LQSFQSERLAQNGYGDLDLAEFLSGDFIAGCGDVLIRSGEQQCAGRQ
jgi:hypothetical protein